MTLGELFEQRGGRSVFSEPNDTDWEDLEKISADEALDFIDERDEIDLDQEEYWRNS